MTAARLTLAQYDRLAGFLRQAWVRLNAATDTYDARRAIADLSVAWQHIVHAHQGLHPAGEGSRPVGSSLEPLVSRYDRVLLARQQDPRDALQQLLDRASALEASASPLLDDRHDAWVVHGALPAMWGLVRGMRHELHARRPRAYWTRALRRTAGGCGGLAALWLLYRAAWFVLPWGCWVTYYRGENFNHPRGVCVATELVKDYGSRRPTVLVGREHWSARWKGYLDVPATAEYTFFSQSDDGLRLWLDDRLLLDNWRAESWGQSGCHASCTLTAGRHALRMDFFNGTGEAALRIKWFGGPIPADTVVGWPYVRKY